MVKFIRIPEKDKERLFVDLCMFMQRTEPLFFTDVDGNKYCAIHGLKVDRYSTSLLGGYTFADIYRIAESRGIVDGKEHINMLICHSVGISSDVNNDNRCDIMMTTGYPIAFCWNCMSSLNCTNASPDFDDELVIETIDNDIELIACLKHLNKYGKLQLAGPVENWIEWFKVYEREVSV